MTNNNNHKEEEEEESIGKYIYNQMKNISTILSIERLLPIEEEEEGKEGKERVTTTTTQSTPPSSSRRVNKFLGTSTNDIQQVKATCESVEYLPVDLQEELQSELQRASMEDVLPLDTWKRMKQKERHYFLDQFYSLKEKYTMERESDEDCSTEELQYFQCSNSSSSSSNSKSWTDLLMNPNGLSWKERLDKCYKKRMELQNCRELMNMFRKTQRVFGRENGLYLRIVKEEIDLK